MGPDLKAESRMAVYGAVLGERFGCECIDQKRKALTDMDSSVVITWGWGGGIRGLNSNGKI